MVPFKIGRGRRELTNLGNGWYVQGSMENADWVGVIVTVVVGLAGVLIPVMLRLNSIQRENRERSSALENRVGDIGKNVDEIRREQVSLGRLMMFAAGRQAEADVRTAGRPDPRPADGGTDPSDMHH